MGADSKIEWCHHSFNPWMGCQKVGPGCENCYAAESTPVRIQRTRGKELWGNELRSERQVTSDANWRKPLAWNAAAEAAGERHRVFCASLADVFEDRPELEEPRAILFDLIEETPHLDWLLLTKRIDLVMDMVPEAWLAGFPRNVWMGTSVENQEKADERIPYLLRCPAAVRFLSCEPLLGPVDLRRLDTGDALLDSLTGSWGIDGRGWTGEGTRVDWIIVGGESGTGARLCDVDWIRSVIYQGRDAGVPTFVKQLGAWPRDRNDSFHAEEIGDPEFWPEGAGLEEDYEPQYQGELCRIVLRDRKGGDPEEWPQDLRVREFPEPATPVEVGR